MPQGQTKSNTLVDEGTEPWCIESEQLPKPSCESAHLQDAHLQETQSKTPAPFISSSFVEEPPPDLSALENTPRLDLKRKRTSLQDEGKSTKKRAPQLPESCAVKDREAEGNTDTKKSDPISHWVHKRSWPKEYFESGGQTWEDLGADREAEKLAEILQQQEKWDKKLAAKVNNMAHPLLAIKRSSASIRRQYEQLGIEPPNELPQEEKSAKYRSPAYEKELASKGSFMYESKLDITEESKALCQQLLDSAQTVVQDSLFRDDRFQTTCRKIRNENEAMVIQDITQLIVPSAKNLATCGATSLENLVESVNKGWNSAIPVTTPRPQPDYSVAFGQSAFTNGQLEKIKPFVGDLLHHPTDFSYLMATWKMYFPFLTCEVKCGASALDIADRQNAHSMTHAVRAIVELYKYAKWEEGFDWKKEVHRQVLAFSISHDDRAVRIYGHYPVLEDERATYYRYPIREFSLMDQRGRDKWTAYKFTKNVYELWMPNHLKQIQKVIDVLPAGLNFTVSSAAFTPATSAENESDLPDPQEIATPTSTSQDTTGCKKLRLPPKVMLQQEIDGLKGQLAQEREQSDRRQIELMDQSNARIDQLMQENKEQAAAQNARIDQLMQENKEQAAAQNARIDQLMQENKEQATASNVKTDQFMDMLKQRLS